MVAASRGMGVEGRAHFGSDAVPAERATSAGQSRLVRVGRAMSEVAGFMVPPHTEQYCTVQYGNVSRPIAAEGRSPIPLSRELGGLRLCSGHGEALGVSVARIVEVKVVGSVSVAGPVPAMPGTLDCALLRSLLMVSGSRAVEGAWCQMRS